MRAEAGGARRSSPDYPQDSRGVSVGAPGLPERSWKVLPTDCSGEHELPLPLPHGALPYLSPPWQHLGLGKCHGVTFCLHGTLFFYKKPVQGLDFFHSFGHRVGRAVASIRSVFAQLEKGAPIGRSLTKRQPIT